MKNLKEIIDRYQTTLPSYNNSVTGYLMWGGKCFYLINSGKPISLNATSDGFILNKKGQVQWYSHTMGKRGAFLRRKGWGKKLNYYYPWPYFPKKKIKAFEVVRIMPGHLVGDILLVTTKLITNYRLQYPEFFKPLYKI